MRSPVLALVGATASGKSALAMEVARRRGDIEIVAVDAFTVYRGMDIGTAKPSPAERSEVAHHGIDLLDPVDELSVAWFQAQARETIADIHGRRATPLLVGGSGLYFRAVVDELDFPPTDARVRDDLERTYASRPEDAHARLVELDPAAAARMQPSNRRRAVRALEVVALTGRRFSDFASAWERYDSIYAELDVAYLEPPADELRARIAVRAERMVDRGLVDEARSLRAACAPPSRTAKQAIGYAEAFAVLAGQLDADDLVAAIARRTRAYARRQRAWFRRDPRCAHRTPADVLARWAAHPESTGSAGCDG